MLTSGNDALLYAVHRASTAARARTPERARVHENALGTALLISPMYLYMREKRNVGAR